MANKGLSGLKGLDGLSSLTPEEQYSFMSAHADQLNIYRNPRQRKQAANILYMNRKFIDTFGEDAFNKLNDGTENSYDYRNQMMFDTQVNKVWDVYKKNSGMDPKYDELSPKAKYEVMKSDYKTPKEFDDFWKHHMQGIEATRKTLQNSRAKNFMPTMAILMAPNTANDVENGVANVASVLGTEESRRKVLQKNNDNIIDKIYRKDADDAAKRLESQISDTYVSLLDKSDDAIKKLFIKVITKGSYKDSNGVPNTGIAEYQARYGNGSKIAPEMRDFSIDDMRHLIAKKLTYDKYLSPMMAATTLDNEAKRYISDHQGAIRTGELLAKDIGISAMSYTADKLNAFGEAYRAAKDADGKKPTVMVDDEGNILDSTKTRIAHGRNGEMVYKGNDGKIHSVHKMQIDNTTLHNLGKNEDGSDIKGAFGIDWMTLNPQYWTRAEQFGTLDENLQKQYEKIGASPYKVIFDPDSDNQLWYDTAKMLSFGAADMLSNFIPFGIGAAGRALSTADKVGKVARGFGKVLDTTGKLLSSETRVGQLANAFAGAGGISYAYNRGAFPETLQQNLANLEEATLKASQKDIWSQYNNDEKYKAYIDKLINARAATKKAQYLAQVRKDGNMQIADMKAVDNQMHDMAQREVLGELTQKRIQERKASKEYGDLLQKAIDGAGDAAFNTFWTEGVKYGFVNTMGYRKFLYTNPTGLTSKVSSSLKGLREVTTKDGLKRIATNTSKFLTRKDKIKQFGQSAISQFWGGSWTNGTDDMQVDAAESMNEDSYKRYLDAYQNGEALADTYGFADGLYSYMKGLKNSLGEESTWNSALVGGLGSITNVMPNFTNIATLMTKEGMESYKNRYTRKIERDENGRPLKNEDGSIKYRDVKRGENWRDRLGFFIQNGVLNDYYGKKLSEEELQSHADYVNNILDQYDDFKDIEKLVAANIASSNMTDLRGKETLDYIKALNSINALNNLGNKSSDPTKMSSVIQNAKSLISNLSKLNEVDLDKGEESPLSEEETTNLIAQYYAANPGIAHSIYEDRQALKTIAHNAKMLQDASDAFDKAEEEIQKIEKNHGTSIDPNIRSMLKMQQALNGHWTERKEKLQSELEDSSSDEKPQDAATVLAIVGGKKNAQSLIKVYDRQEQELIEDINTQKEKTKSLKAKVEDAAKEVKEAEESEDSDRKLKADDKLKNATAKLQSSKEQENYYEDMLNSTRNKRTSLQGSINKVESPDNEVKDKVLTADEIFSLDPVTRARMMNEENRDLYSKEQQVEIEKLENQLLMKDADALQKIQDIAMLTHRINANEDAYSRIAKNPLAAAMEAENQRDIAAITAEQLINHRNAETLVDFINHYDNAMDNYDDVTTDTKNNLVFNILRKYNSNMLNTIAEENLLPKYEAQVLQAKDWVRTAEDIVNIIDEADKDKTWKDNLRNNISNLIEGSNTKEELLNKLEKVIDDLGESQEAEDLDYVLKGLEKLGYQRDATVIEDRKKRKEREEKEKAKKEEERKEQEETQRKAEEAARKAKENKEQSNLVNTSKEANSTISETQNVNLGLDGDSSSKPDTKTSLDNSSSINITPSNAQYGFSVNTNEYVKPLNVNQEETVYIGNDNGDGTISVVPISHKRVKSVDALSGYFDFVGGYDRQKSDNLHVIEPAIVKKDGEYYKLVSKGKLAWTDKDTYDKDKKKSSASESHSETKGDNNTNKNDTFAETKEQKDAGESNLIIEGDEVTGNSPSLEEQASQSQAEGKEIKVSNINESEDLDNANDLQQQVQESDAYSLGGNGMSRYTPDGLKNKRLVKKRGKKKNDNMDKFYAWMDAAGIKLQNIIDRELHTILELNPHAKVKFMGVIPKDNATHDADMREHCMLVLDYDDKINKGITGTHDDANGGVIESNGKKYLIIGVAGYPNGNKAKQRLRDIIWDTHTREGLHFKTERQKFSDEHPNERFYVNEEYSTEIVPYSLIPGYIIKQTDTDAAPEYRDISKLLADKDRNPLGLTMKDLTWGIQTLQDFLTVGGKGNISIMFPRNDMANLGRAFVMIPASNGKYIPAYFKVLKYQEMREGSALKEKIEPLLNRVFNSKTDETSYKDAIAAINELCDIFYLHKDGNDIHRKGKVITLDYENGESLEFHLDKEEDKEKFLKAFKDMNPRVNITAKVLGSQDLIKMYEEAGAFQTDAALFTAAGSSYSIYALDKNGKMMMPAEPINPPSKGDRDFKGSQQQIIYNKQYYIEDNGVYSLDGDVVTDEKLIKQLEYNKRILNSELSPVMSNRTWDYYILSSGEHPEVVMVDRNTKEVKPLAEKKAKELIDRINEENAKAERDMAAEEAIASMEEDSKAQQAYQEENPNIMIMDGGVIIDTETGEIIQDTTGNGSKDESPISPEEESKEPKDTTPSSTDTSAEDAKEKNFEVLRSKEDKAPTQTFEELYNQKEYKMQIMKLLKKKFKEMPKSLADKKKFLKDKNIEVDAIGTSEKDIQAWLKTIEDCR